MMGVASDDGILGDQVHRLTIDRSLTLTADQYEGKFVEIWTDRFAPIDLDDDTLARYIVVTLECFGRDPAILGNESRRFCDTWSNAVHNASTDLVDYAPLRGAEINRPTYIHVHDCSVTDAMVQLVPTGNPPEYFGFNAWQESAGHGQTSKVVEHD